MMTNIKTDTLENTIKRHCLLLFLIVSTVVSVSAQSIFESEYEEYLEEYDPDEEFEATTLESEYREKEHPDSLAHADYFFARLRTQRLSNDTTTNWWKLLWKGRIELDNPKVHYPKFPRFCFNIYYWADRVFNGQDPQYVVGTGRRWKARLTSDNWVDSYALDVNKDMHLWLMSDFNLNLGAYLQFMAVSVGMSHDVREILGKKKGDHKKMEFGFNCARFNAEFYYTVNNEGSYLRHFGEYKDGGIFKMQFPGLRVEKIGVNLSYFINNRRYSQGAAYNFSKFQLRSQGSPIVGFVYNHINMNVDLRDLDPELQPYLTIAPENYRFHYNSYCFMGGYGQNMVFNPHILFNITVTPAFGWCHTYGDSTEQGQNNFSLNILARSSFTYNFKDFFVCLLGKFDGNLYHSHRYNMLNFMETLQANVGVRF